MQENDRTMRVRSFRPGTTPVADTEPSGDVSRFIERFVSSTEHVEVLRQLCGTPIRTIAPGELETRVHVGRATIDAIVRDLEPVGLMRDDTGVLRLEASPVDVGTIAALIDMYNASPLSVVRAIRASRAPKKSFADIFRDKREL
jgi:hypothetical protein